MRMKAQDLRLADVGLITKLRKFGEKDEELRMTNEIVAAYEDEQEELRAIEEEEKVLERWREAKED
jgi:hypothetical protein